MRVLSTFSIKENACDLCHSTGDLENALRRRLNGTMTPLKHMELCGDNEVVTPYNSFITKSGCEVTQLGNWLTWKAYFGEAVTDVWVLILGHSETPRNFPSFPFENYIPNYNPEDSLLFSYILGRMSVVYIMSKGHNFLRKVRTQNFQNKKHIHPTKLGNNFFFSLTFY